MKKQIDSARESIGRNVIFYTTVSGACTICVASGYLDSINNISTYYNCPECSGSYWKNSKVGTEVLARVHWVTDEAVTATPGGKYYLGDATVTIEKSHLELAMACQSETGTVEVDGREMTITRIQPIGAFDISRYRVILTGTGSRPNVTG